MNLGTLMLVLTGVSLNTAAQFLLKAGTRALGEFGSNGRSALGFFLAASTNFHVLFGLVCYVASFGLWLAVLSRLEVSLAYPLLSIGYVLSAIAAYFLFGEPLTLFKISGIVLILAGVGLLAQSR